MTTATIDARSLRIIAAYNQARDVLADLDEYAALEAIDHDPRKAEAYDLAWPDETVTLGHDPHRGFGVRIEIADPATGDLEGWVIVHRGGTTPVIVDADDIRRRDGRPWIGYVETARRLALTPTFRGLPWAATLAMCRTVAER